MAENGTFRWIKRMLDHVDDDYDELILDNFADFF